jgi:hypothetical protein
MIGWFLLKWVQDYDACRHQECRGGTLGAAVQNKSFGFRCSYWLTRKATLLHLFGAHILVILVPETPRKSLQIPTSIWG